MLGRTVHALTRIDPQGGKVVIDGECWQAVSDLPVATGEMAEIIGISGLTLQIARTSSVSTEPIT